LNGVPEQELSGELVDYIQEGERAGIHNGYKCSICKRWYDVPSNYVPDVRVQRRLKPRAARRDVGRRTWQNCIVIWRCDPHMQSRLTDGTTRSDRAAMDDIMRANGDKNMMPLRIISGLGGMGLATVRDNSHSMGCAS